MYNSAIELLTLKEVGDMLRISRSTMHRLIEKGELPAIKISGSWRFRLREIEKYLKQNEHKTT